MSSGEAKRVTLHNLFPDERVKYMSVGAFRKKTTRLQLEAFKHFDEVWQVEEEAVLVPYPMYLQIQAELAKLETKQ